MSVALTLEEGTNTADVPLTEVRRVLIEHNPALAEFALEVRGPLRPEPVRVIQLSLDTVYNADPAQQERNLSSLLDRIEVLKPTHVWLEASADLDGDGIADAAYFPTQHLPLRADLFSRVAWQLASRTDVKVYAVLPVTGYRLAPAQVLELYGDLARHASFDGLRFTQGDTDFTRQLAASARRWRAVQVAGDISMPDKTQLPRRMRELQLGGELNFGYSRDDAARNDPPLARIAPAMSLRVHPLPLPAKEQ